MNIAVLKIVRDNIEMGSVLSFAEVMIIQQAIDAVMLQAEPVSQPYKLPPNSFTNDELEMMAHGDNPQANAYRELLALRRNSPVIPDGSEDTKRLDWLDAQNKRLNEYYGTSYGWKFDANFQRNAMMLNDSNYPVMTVRQAIDQAIAAAPKQEGK